MREKRRLSTSGQLPNLGKFKISIGKSGKLAIVDHGPIVSCWCVCSSWDLRSLLGVLCDLPILELRSFILASLRPRSHRSGGFGPLWSSETFWL